MRLSRSWSMVIAGRSRSVTTATCLMPIRFAKNSNCNGAIFSSTSDTEVVLHKIARSRATDLIGAIVDTFTEIEGAYSMVFLTKDSLIAVRDPRGFRPLCLGQLGDAYVIASETCAFDLIDATYLRDVQPGEILVIDRDGLHSSFPLPKLKPAHCIFEHVYFSRPDSIVFGRSVNKSRHKMGQQLAREHPARCRHRGAGAGLGSGRRDWVCVGVRIEVSIWAGAQSLRRPHIHRAQTIDPPFWREGEAESGARFDRRLERGV